MLSRTRRMSSRLLLPSLAAAMACAAPARSGPVYRNDFDAGVGLEWSNPSTAETPSGRGFLGRFGNDTVTLRLTDLPAHTEVTVAFDLYIIQSWDGSQEGVGPDL